MLPCLRRMAVARKRRSEQFFHVPVKEKHLYGQLRSDEWIVRTDQVRKFSPTKRKSVLIEQPTEWIRWKRLGPMSNGIKSLEPWKRFVSAEQLISPLPGNRNLES